MPGTTLLNLCAFFFNLSLHFYGVYIHFYFTDEKSTDGKFRTLVNHHGIGKKFGVRFLLNISTY